MIKRSKFYAPPPSGGKDIKQLFAYAIERGLGQPVDASGVPVGHWTPETLAEAISHIDHDRSSVDIRTVQYWFQPDNRRNISAENCRWLAIIFGCGDGDAISDWQAALLAARRLFQQARKRGRDQTETSRLSPNYASACSQHQERVLCHQSTLAVRTEALFNNEDPHTLPLAVFIGACALVLIAFGLDVHSVVHRPEDGIPRQIALSGPISADVRQKLSEAAGTDQSYIDHALSTEIKTLLAKNIASSWQGFDRSKYAPPKKGELQTLSRMMLQLDPTEQTNLRGAMKDSLALIPLQTLLTEAATYLASDAIKTLRKRLN